jgi:hypothetical protein
LTGKKPAEFRGTSICGMLMLVVGSAAAAI